MGAGITGVEQLDAMIATLRSVAEGPEYFQAARGAVESYLQGTIAAGTTPDKRPWARRKSDGGRTLKNAAETLTVTVSGQRVVVRIRGRHAFQHWGAQEHPKREIIPTAGMPAELGNAIRLGLVEPFVAKTRAGKRGYAYYRARGISPRSVR